MKVSLQYHPRLYLGEGLEGKELERAKKCLENHPLFSDVFVLVPCRNGVDQLEFFPGRLLAQPYYQKNPPLIIGIFHSREEAVAQVIKLTEECVRLRGDSNLREYLLC